MQRPRITIQMLGAFEATVDGRVVTVADYGSRKARELLKWLVDGRNEILRDDVLVHAAWPDVPLDRALPSLRVRISELRKLFGLSKHDQLERVNDGYRLRVDAKDIAVDVDDFIRLAKRASDQPRTIESAPLLEQALAMYKGDYLADDPDNVQWKSTREHCRSLFFNVGYTLAGLYEQSDQYASGIALLQRLLNLPGREERHYRALMRLLYLNDDQAGALHVYQQCWTYLDEEFGVRPMRETVRLMERVLRQEPLGQRGTVFSPPRSYYESSAATKEQLGVPFIGREVPLGRLDAQVQLLHESIGSVSWVCGPSGIGKTRLVQEAVFAPADAARRVLWIQGSRLNARIPYAAIVEGIQTGMYPRFAPEEKQMVEDPPLNTLQPLLGWEGPEGRDRPGVSLAPSEPGHDQSANLWLRQDLLELFRRLSLLSPLIICFDDAHDLDSESKSIVQALAKRTRDWPIALVISSQSALPDSRLGSEIVDDARGIEAIQLGPLARSSMSQLTGSGGPWLWTEQWLGDLYEACRGEPLMLVERLFFLKNEGLIDFVDGKIIFKASLLRLMTGESPGSGDVSVRRPRRDARMEDRLSRLDETERSLLDKAAVLAESLTLDRLRTFAHVPDDTAWERALAQLFRHGFLSLAATDADGDPTLSFTHHRVQQLIYDKIPIAERQWHHYKTFELLKEEMSGHDGTGAGMQRMRLYSAGAWHALMAEEWETAAAWSLRAARDAESISFGPEVVALYRQSHRAARHLDTTHPLRLKAKQALADALFTIGSPKEALPLYEYLSDCRSDLVDRQLVVRRLILTYIQLNETEKAFAMSDRFLAEARTDDRSHGLALLTRSRVDYHAGDPASAIQRGQKAIELLSTADDPTRVAAVHRKLALVYWDLGHYKKAIASTNKSLDLYRESDAPDRLVVLNQLGELYQDLLCVDRAMKTHQKALALALKDRNIAMSVEIWRNVGLNFIYKGHTEKGMDTLESAWRQVEDLDLGAYWREVHLRSLIEAHLLANDSKEARRLLTQYISVAGPREAPFVRVFQAAVDILDGNFTEGKSTLMEVKEFWERTKRWGRAFHVLMFVGRAFMLHNEASKARYYLNRAADKIERIRRSLPRDLADEMKQSRQFRSIQRLTHLVS